jgi:hypothetical protein
LAEILSASIERWGSLVFASSSESVANIVTSKPGLSSELSSTVLPAPEIMLNEIKHQWGDFLGDVDFVGTGR